MKTLLAILTILSTSGCIYYAAPTMQDIPPQQSQNYVTIQNTNAQIKENVTPKDYGVLATRITNKMLDDTKSVYQKIPQPKIYIREIIKETDTLEDGFYYANKNVFEIIKNSKTFIPVATQSQADYHLQSIVFEYQNPNTNAPLILYNMRLLDKEGNIINQWAESITQLSNDDRSWW